MNALAARSLVDRLTAIVDAAARRPQHVALASLVVGLLAGPRVAATLVVPAAGACVLAFPGRAIGAIAAIALLTGAWVARERVAALASGPLVASAGHWVQGIATIGQPARAGRFGDCSAMGRLRAEPVLVRWRPAGTGGWRPDGSRPKRDPDGCARVPVGARVRVAGPAATPGDFAASRGAHIELRARILHVVGRRGGPSGFVDRVRDRAIAGLRRGVPRREAALLRGMVLGDDTALADADRSDLRTAGLTHLVAASGANIALLAALVVGASIGLGIPFTLRWTLVLALIVVYVPLAGGGPSIQRAGVMGAAGVLALLSGRPGSRGYALLGAAAVTLVCDPRAAGDPGWQLSFVAVAALLVWAGPWAMRLRDHRVPVGLAEALAATAAATLSTAPLIAAHFGRAAPWSLPANLIATPLVAPIMWIGFVAAAISQVSVELGGSIAALAGPPVACVLLVGHLAAAAPGAGATASVATTTLVCLGALIVIERRWVGAAMRGTADRAASRWARDGVRGSARVPVGRLGAMAASVCLVLALLVARQRGAGGGLAPPAGLRVTFLDVGQGDATLVQDREHAMLIDTGPPDAPILARLRDAGIRRLDVLAVTHAQADHEGGAAAVLRTLPVGVLLDGRDGVRGPGPDAVGAAATTAHVRRVIPDRGMVLRAGGLALDVLSPVREPTADHAGEDPNERAIVSEVRDGAATVLLTADAESDVTGPLQIGGPIDVLKVAHHGSADPGLADELATWKPRVAVISVGAHNTYGHPSASTLGMLRSVPRVERTDRDGTVRLDLVGSRWEVHAEGG